MGRRGPKPTPAAILKPRGSRLAGKAAKGMKPKPGIPNCPTWLDREGKACWKRCVAALASVGVLTKGDRDALAGLCENWSRFLLTTRRWRKAEADGADALDVKRWADMASGAYAAYGRGCASFGLTPADRTRVSAPPKEPKAEGVSRFFQDEIA